MKGARLLLEGANSITLVTDARGTARNERIPVGVYRLVPEPVDGLMGTPARLRIVIRQGEAAAAAVSYDTGIR